MFTTFIRRDVTIILCIFQCNLAFIFTFVNFIYFYADFFILYITNLFGTDYLLNIIKYRVSLITISIKLLE